MALACRTDTEGLARERPPPEVVGVGGVASASDDPGGGAGGRGASGSDDPDAAASDVGSARILVLNGVVDRSRLFVCLQDPAAATARVEVVPPEGVAFAAYLELEADWDLEGGARRLAVFGGASSELSGRSCETLGAELEQSRAASFAPAGADASVASADSGVRSDAGAEAGAPPAATLSDAGTLVGELSLSPGLLRPGGLYVLMAAGCAGAGALGSDELCGPVEPLGSARSSLSLVRVDAPPYAGQVGIQFLNASRAVTPRAVTLQLANGNRPTLATDVAFGAIRPRLVAPISDPAGIELHESARGVADHVGVWSQLVEQSGLGPLEPGRGYVVAFVGPSVDAGQTPGANPQRFTLLPGSP